MDDILNLIGVGIGPSNLSLAALAHDLPEVRAVFLERQDRFSWHPGLMFPAARMQTSFLKDLVTAVDPTNAHSFLNYVVQHGRFYPFLARERGSIGRREFADYLGWVAEKLDTLRFGAEVREVRLASRGFEVVDDRGHVRATDHVCVGTGRAPRVPDCARDLLGKDCFHAIDIMERDLDVAGRRVAVVGGGADRRRSFARAPARPLGSALPPSLDLSPSQL